MWNPTVRLNASWLKLGVIAVAICVLVVALVWEVSPRGDTAAPESGDVAFERIVDALRTKDLDFVVSRLRYATAACGVPTQLPDGEVPGPECDVSETPGTFVEVFPMVSCDARLVRSDEAPALVRQSLSKFELYGGIALRLPNERQRHYALQEGSFGAIGKIGGGSSAVMVSVSDNGDVVNLWPGCGEFAAGLMDERFSEAVLFGPIR